MTIEGRAVHESADTAATATALTATLGLGGATADQWGKDREYPGRTRFTFQEISGPSLTGEPGSDTAPEGSRLLLDHEPPGLLALFPLRNEGKFPRLLDTVSGPVTVSTRHGRGGGAMSAQLFRGDTD